MKRQPTKRESPVSVRLEPPMQQRLKQISQAEGGRSVGSIIKQAVQEFVKRWEERNRKK